MNLCLYNPAKYHFPGLYIEIIVLTSYDLLPKSNKPRELFNKQYAEDMMIMMIMVSMMMMMMMATTLIY